MLAAWQATIVDGFGTVQASASVEVKLEISGALAATFSDRAGTTPLTNPITADSNGFVRFYVAGGAYKITATLGAFSREWRHVAVGLLSELDTVDSAIVRYDDTADEIAASVTPVNYQYPPGHVLRFVTNTTPGTTDMTSAFQDAALSSLDPFAPAGLYLITGSIPLRDNQHWRLDGVRIAITGNTKVFTAAAGIDDWSISGPLVVTGDNDSTGSLSGSGAAVEITDSEHWSVGKVTAKNIKGYGIHVLPGSSTSDRAEHGVIDDPQCYACTIGIGLDAGTGAEYVTVDGPVISRCGTGMAIAAGNANVNGGSIVDNTTNVEVSAGSNHAHGTFTGTHINHPTGTYNIKCTNVTNGHTFDGCHIYEGAIWLNGCKGIVFSGGIMAPSSIINDTSVSPVSGYNFCRDNLWQPGFSTDVTSNNSGEHELIILGAVGPALLDAISGLPLGDPSAVYVNARRAPASTQALTSGVAATLVFNTEVFDRRNAYNSSTGTFTVPAEMAGLYRIRAAAIFSGTAMSTTASVIDVKRNGTSTALFMPTINGTTVLSIVVDTELLLAAADTITLVATITGTSPVFGQTTYESRLMIERIS